MNTRADRSRRTKLAFAIGRLFSVAAGAIVPAIASAQSDETRALVFTNLTVIDATGAPPQAGMTVVVRGDRIAAIGKTRDVPVPRGARVVNGAGKFMIPGLWDMHVHLSDARPSAIPALVANGVTGVRDMGSRLTELDEWRVRIESGSLIGPRVFRAGPILNGKQFGPVQLAVADEAEARAAVRTLAHVGVDFIKVHLTLTREQYFAILREAKVAGLRVAGHIPGDVRPEEASDSGQASIEHTETLFQGTFDPSVPRDTMLAMMTRLFQRFAKNRTYYTPTLIMYKVSADWRGFAPHAQSKYVARSAADRMAKVAEQYKQLPEVLEGRKRIFAEFLGLVRMMHANGAQVMTGTDLADGRIFPGFSVHEELALLVDAGFAPGAAIEAATRVPAEFLGLKDAGTIKQGNRADVVVLNADPLQDIRNSTKIDAVVLRGQMLNRARLDALLAEAERLAAKN